MTLTVSVAIPDTAPCPKCGLVLPFIPRPDTKHWGAVSCPDHGYLWLPKPGQEKKQRRKGNLRLLLELPEWKQGFCWQCNRPKDHLKALRPSLTLEVHHIVSVKDGGSDSAENLMVLCTECHAEVHRRREAFERYLPKQTNEPEWLDEWEDL